MSKVDLQTPKYNVVGDSASVKANHQVPDSVLNTDNKVTQEELKQISMFSSDSTRVENALKIGAVAAGSVALAYGAKRFGLLNKLFPVVEDAGLQYRKVLGKKVGLKLSSTPYEKIVIPDNSQMGKRIKNLHPTNLRNELERCKYSNWDFPNLLHENPNLSRTVGSLPSSWTRNFKSAEIQQKVDEVLSQYAREFHAVEEGVTPSISKLQEKLSTILGTEVKILSLGGGKIGSAYKISAFGKDCVYKVYYNKPMMGFINHGEHGNYSELKSAIQAKKYAPKKFAEFYMGRFGENQDGYILTKFVPDTKISTKQPSGFSKQLQRMISGDPSPDNIVNGITRDYGVVGFSRYSNLSPEAQKIARELFLVLDGKSPEKVAKIAQKYQGKQEFEEVKTYITYIIENSYRRIPDFFASKKSQLQVLGLDCKPDIRTILSRNTTLEPYAKYYGLTVEQAEKLREAFRASKKS